MEGKSIIEKMQEQNSKLTWSMSDQKFIKTPDDIVEFFKEFEKLCRKHDITLSHEDGQGGFEIEHFDEDTLKWIYSASDTRG
ncbi:hypothetical protein [Rossellomorea marisflavi]|uniref:hypothetical protein n=1 Tax=Rossellomorea marisflavi TaxID=189381 RepID=UPI003F9EC64E